MNDDKKTGGYREGAGRKKTLTDSQVRKARSIDDEEYQLVLKIRDNPDLGYAVKSMIENID
jgi:hypothetical protein